MTSELKSRHEPDSPEATPAAAGDARVGTFPGTPAGTLLISEMYSSIQGESTHAGRPCFFIRLTGCPLRCVWCDTEHAFRGGERIEIDEIVSRAVGAGLGLVEVTGGEPLAQPGCAGLLRALLAESLEVLLETSGSEDISVVPPGVHIIMDLKCPGSGESHANRMENLALLRAKDELKFVIAGREDYEWARDITLGRSLAGICTVLFSAAHPALSHADLAAWILEDRLPVRQQIQMHRVIWPDAERGV